MGCEDASEGLEGLLSELQMQRDNAKGLIEETFQSYKAMLVKKKVSLFFMLIGYVEIVAAWYLWPSEYKNKTYSTCFICSAVLYDK